MKFHFSRDKERGAVLLGAIVTLLAVTALGSTLILLSQTELKKTASEKCMEVARYNSESATMSVAKLIRLVGERVDATGDLGIPEGDALAPGIVYPEATGNNTKEAEFALKVLGGPDDQVCEDVTLAPAGENMDAAADLASELITVEAQAGSASNVHIAGYSYGIGLGGAAGGGTNIFYTIVGLGGGGMQECRHISYARYRRALGVAGGM